MKRNNEYMICSECEKKTDVEKDDVPEIEWEEWKCSKCDGAFYGQEFINWIADRISPSTSDDTTGRFVLRELVQNADDVEAEIIVFQFCSDALYVYNNGFGFRSSVEGGPGDFDRISRVLAKPKEKEFYTSGNFGSGFQTVYLFTNEPEVHSHGKSFRYDPTIPKKSPLYQDEKIDSPYKMDKTKKGSVFRFPWRTKKNAMVTRNGRRFFEKERPWKRWNLNARQNLFKELKEYLHDSILCCQHLKQIRIYWDDGTHQKGYQVERDFTLRFINQDGQIGKIIEGPGNGRLTVDDWTYDNHQEYRYLIESDFVRDVSMKKTNICTIVKDVKEGMKVRMQYGSSFDRNSMSYEEYIDFLRKSKAIKKSDIHILIPLFPWKDRKKGYQKKAWSYSVIPLPKESGNNFTLTAHLFPKQTREAFELHQERAKKEWLEHVLLSAGRLYLRTYEHYVQLVQKMKGLNAEIKQTMFLDYLPTPRLGDWVNVILDDTEEETKIDEDIFGEVFSKEILLFDGRWFKPFEYNPKKDTFSAVVDFPRDDIERGLLEDMDFITFSEAFLNHPRFKELTEFRERLKEKIMMTDEKFVKLYGGSSEIMEGDESFFSLKIEKNGKLMYNTTIINKEFIDRLIQHCLKNYPTDIMKTIPIIPNKRGELCRPGELRIEPSDKFEVIKEIIPRTLYPHPEFEREVKKYINEIEDPEELLEGIKENKEVLEEDIELIKLCYEWLDKTKMILPDDISDYPIVLDDMGKLWPSKDIFWVPTNHHDLIAGFLQSINDRTILISKSIFGDFEKFICEKLKVRIFDYPHIIRTYYNEIEGTSEKKENIQIKMVEGVLLGIHGGYWDKKTIKELPFLPVHGGLREPLKCCIGQTGKKDIDEFIGSIDNEIQRVIIEDERNLELLVQGLGCGDLEKNYVGWITDSIDRYYIEHEKGSKCELKEDVHRLISRCLGEIIDDLVLDSELCDKRIIPIQYKGHITLSTPTKWPYIEKKKRELENYQADWPWPEPSEDLLKMIHPSVRASIRFLKLHKRADQDLQRKIENKLIMKNLLTKEKDGIMSRGILMHFIIPTNSDMSLFIDSSLKDFLDDQKLDDDEIIEIKKSFLPFLREYYKRGEHRGEQIDPKVPCLYDSRGVWREPEDFALKIEEDLEVLGYSELHTDFSDENGWDRITLTNIGVKDRLEFEKLEKAILRISKEKRTDENDRSILKILMLILEEGIGKKEDWENLSGTEWIPTKDGRRKKPIHALIPSENVKRIIGDCDLEILIDDTSLPESDRNFWTDFLKEDLERIGLRALPTFEELIMVWAYYQKQNISPPPLLFDELERNFEKWQKEFLRLNAKKIKYFCEGEWNNPRFVVMESTDNMPPPLRERFSFVNKHEKLLKWLRGETEKEGVPSVKIKDALNLLLEISDEEYGPVWKYIIGRRSEIEEELKQNFEEKEIILHDSERYPPSHVLIAPRGGSGLKHVGKLGEWLSFTNKRIFGEIETLLALGAMEFDTLFTKNEHLISVVKSIIKENPQPGSQLWSDYVSIISNMIDKEIILPSNLVFIPIKENDGVSFESPSKTSLRDESEIWELFKDESRLQFFNPSVIPKEDISPDDLRQWLNGCGAKDLREIANTVEEPELDDEDTEQETTLTENLQDAIKRLDDIVSIEFDKRDYDVIKQKMKRLKDYVIYSCKSITRRYEIDMTTIDGGSILSKEEPIADYYIDKSGVIFLRKGIGSPMTKLEKIVKRHFNPGFSDRYRNNYWEGAVRFAFSQREQRPLGIPFESALPDIDDNIEKMNDWWLDYIRDGDKSSFPTLDGDFWWPTLGLDDENGREDILREKIGLKDRKLMFNIFSMATMLGTNVRRKQIKNFLDILKNKNLSFSEMYEMKEEEILRKMIDDIFDNIDSTSILEKDYPHLRRRIFDVLVLRRAMQDEEKGELIMGLINEYMEIGLSPEQFLIKGISDFGVPRFMRGFKGMFTGQIYFIVRELVRLGSKDDWHSIPAKEWQDIAFHAPSQVRNLISDIGGGVPGGDGWREKLAKEMTQKIKDYEGLNEWYDIPFFIYCDEFCRHCKRGDPPEECEMNCYQRW